jgi:hypothetical protein
MTSRLIQKKTIYGLLNSFKDSFSLKKILGEFHSSSRKNVLLHFSQNDKKYVMEKLFCSDEKNQDKNNFYKAQDYFLSAFSSNAC